jgi:phosphatidylglycerophosphate synthase
MLIPLYLLVIQGLIGAFDTLYFHEWRAKLPANYKIVANELYLHAFRDFIYAVIFGTLPWFAWQGYCLILLLILLISEIIITLLDFAVETRIRKMIDADFAGERVTHAIMGIIYGAMLATLAPTLLYWWQLPTGMIFKIAPIPLWLSWALTIMAIGVFCSGIRDFYYARK